MPPSTGSTSSREQGDYDLWDDDSDSGSDSWKVIDVSYVESDSNDESNHQLSIRNSRRGSKYIKSKFTPKSLSERRSSLKELQQQQQQQQHHHHQRQHQQQEHHQQKQKQQKQGDWSNQDQQRACEAIRKMIRKSDDLKRHERYEQHEQQKQELTSSHFKSLTDERDDLEYDELVTQIGLLVGKLASRSPAQSLSRAQSPSPDVRRSQVEALAAALQLLQSVAAQEEEDEATLNIVSTTHADYRDKGERESALMRDDMNMTDWQYSSSSRTNSGDSEQYYSSSPTPSPRRKKHHSPASPTSRAQAKYLHDARAGLKNRSHSPKNSNSLDKSDGGGKGVGVGVGVAERERERERVDFPRDSVLFQQQRLLSPLPLDMSANYEFGVGSLGEDRERRESVPSSSSLSMNTASNTNSHSHHMRDSDSLQWNCVFCTLLNNPSFLICSACGETREEAYKQQPPLQTTGVLSPVTLPTGGGFI